MTIAAFNKVTLLGMTQKKSDILQELQTSGCVHLFSIKAQKKHQLTQESSTLIEKIKKSLLYLKHSSQQGLQKTFDKDFNADIFVSTVLENEKSLIEAIDRRDYLQDRIKELAVWGNIIMPKAEELANIKLWFYKIKLKDRRLIPNSLTVREIYRDELYIYLIVLSPSEPPADDLPSKCICIGDASLDDLRNDLNDVTEKIEDLHEVRHHLTRYRLLLLQEFARYADRTALLQAHEYCLDQDNFFIVQGWVPQTKLAELDKFRLQANVAVIIEEVAQDDMPPTLLQTFPWAKGGVELVNFYQTPGYRALDPSLMVFFSFAIFFAMIMADAGYGLIIAITTIFCWKKLSKINASQWLKPLLILISVFSILYGMLLGSYFGVEPSSHSLLAPFKLLDINNFDTMMALVLVIGCLHIIMANGMRSWYATSIYERLQSLGFVFLIIGFMLLTPGIMYHYHYLLVTSIVILTTSTVLIIYSASDFPVVNFKSFILRVGKGLTALSQLTSLFGDILSYLRLFALGLAGASLALTFNHIAKHIVLSSEHGYGWVLAFLVLLFGQSLNFLLCVMSGVIHGLRLNYIEFFKWSVKEEGYTYAPLRRTEMNHE